MAKKILSGLIQGPGLNGEIIGGFNPNGTKTTKPITFLGGTVLGFSATLGIGPLEESSLSVELLNDCKVTSDVTNPQGDYFLGEVNLGGPVFFDLCEATALEPNREEHEEAVAEGKECFKFGGILQSYTAQQNSGGLIFNARVIDPRSLLAGVTLVVGKSLAGPRKHRNYYNVYAAFEYTVLKTSRQDVQERILTLPGSREEDKLYGTDEPWQDCMSFGEADSDDRGMPANNVLWALTELVAPKAYSTNYGEEFVPELEGRDLTVATAQNNLNHQQNVFNIDLWELPKAPLYYRVPGPSISLLDFINNLCEATGHIFHVVLEESKDPNKLHTIKVKVTSIKDLQGIRESFKSEILAYNGRATDLNYGKELSTNNTRTLMIGEQRHEMYESVNIEPFFGEDKYGDPIVPLSGFGSGECGWDIEIYLDDLNHSLRCPLFDYGILGNTERENEVVQRKVKVSETHIRAAMSSFELWKKFVMNPYNPEDMSQVIRRNFPDLTNKALTDLYTNLLRSRDTIEEITANPGVADTGLPPPEFDKDAVGRSMADQLNNWNARMIDSLAVKQREQIEMVHSYFSQMGRTYYGKQFVASVTKDLCVANAGFYDIKYIRSAGIDVRNKYTIVDDPCADDDPNIKNVRIIDNRLWKPKQYSHIPTNDGAWIEGCGYVLGLGGGSNDDVNTNPYLDFFRTEDGRVGPIARFDSSLATALYRTEGLVDDGVSWDTRIPLPEDITAVQRPVASLVNGVFITGELTPEQLLFVSGICGDLDVKDWSSDNYITIRTNAICDPPTTGVDPLDAIDLPTNVWAKFTVGDKIYVDDTGCLTFTDTQVVEKKVDNDGCCGRWQTLNPKAECYWNVKEQGKDTIPPDENCIQREIVTKTETVCSGVVRIPIIFDEPCFKKYCEDQMQLEMLATELEAALHITSGILEGKSKPYSYTYGKDGLLRNSNGEKVPTTYRFCHKPQPTGISVISSALDYNSANNHKMVPTAFIPTAVAIPVKSNIDTYGPWKSENFETSAGGVEFVQDTDFCPWVFNSVAVMNKFAQDIINDRCFNKSEIETGGITIPTFPEKPLGFIENGPNLTNINVNMGSNGVTTTYSFKTYTPKYGGLKNLEKQALTSNIKLINQVRRLANEKERKFDSLKRKLKPGASPLKGENGKPLTDQGTLQRIIVGETYPFSLITKPNYVENTGTGEVEQSGYIIVSSGDRTVVGTETLQKSVVELRYDYRKKAFMSWDGLLSPVRNGSVDPSGNLPMYAHYSGFEHGHGAKSIFNSPNPPVEVSGKHVHNISIDRKYSDPLTNHFGSGEHHHQGSGAGHNIDVVGRGDKPPESGVIMNLYGQSKWNERYSDEYRFLGLRGPLVLHQWGYDTQGKPIPNAIDDIDLIKKSGVFRSQIGTGEDPTQVTGLQDYFLENWLHQPTTWPVAPVDLRFDRQRGMWVSPPDYKIVVVEAQDTISPYATGEGYLINEKEDRKYNQPIYDASGVLVKAEEGGKAAKITIEDRIGRNISTGEKSYAYFDAFTSTYLLMGGGGGSSIKIGKFCNQWPSLSNVKDPKNAVKKVILYEPAESGCDGYLDNATPTDKCPWALEPVLTTISGVEVPVVVEVMNLFSNVAAHEYQTKWCAVAQNGEHYYLIAAEC